jgi:hypothetical protein
MNVLITLTSAGTDTGPFNLYSNVDNYTTAFETNISRGILVAGYTSTVVPPGTSAIRVKSMGICTNYVDIVLVVPSTTTTTTTAAPSPTTTTTSTTTAAPAPIITTTTTSTTTAYVGSPTTTTTSTTSSTSTSTSTSTTSTTSTSTSTTTAYVGDPTTTTTSTSTTSTTTTNLATEWYQITRCDTLDVAYSVGYPLGSFALNDRVIDFLSNVYTITTIYTSDPGGTQLYIGPTGFTGCVDYTTTTTTTTGGPIVPSSILVNVNDSSGDPLSCLGTDYPVTIQTATATLYDQYGNTMNAVGDIVVTLNTTYTPCFGSSYTVPVTVTILDGYSSNSTSWDASRTVDCGQSNCVLETQFYDCALSNTASLSFKEGTVTCTPTTTTTTTTAPPTPPTTTTTTTAEPVAPTTTTTTTAEPVTPTTSTTTTAEPVVPTTSTTTTAEPVAPTTTTTTSTTEVPATTTTTTTEAPSVNAQWYAVPSGSGGCGTAVFSVTKNSSSVVSVSFSSGQNGTFSVVAGDVLVITTLAGASGSVCSDPYVEYSGNQYLSDGQTGLGPVQAQITVTVSAGDILNGSIILGGTLDGSVIPS